MREYAETTDALKVELWLENGKRVPLSVLQDADVLQTIRTHLAFPPNCTFSCFKGHHGAQSNMIRDGTFNSNGVQHRANISLQVPRMFRPP